MVASRDECQQGTGTHDVIDIWRVQLDQSVVHSLPLSPVVWVLFVTFKDTVDQYSEIINTSRHTR